MEFRAASEYMRHLVRKSICPPTLADIGLQDEIDALTPFVRKKKVLTEEEKAQAKTKTKKVAVKKADRSGEEIVAKKTTKDKEEQQEEGRQVEHSCTKPPSPQQPPKNSNNTERNEDEASAEVVDLEARLKHCEAQLQKLERLHAPTAERHHMSAFGFETTYHIDDAYVRRYVDEPLQCVMKIVNDIFFNDNFPENRTIRFSNGDLELRRRGNWVRVERKNDVLRRMAERAVDVIDNAIAGTSLKMDEFIEEFRENKEDVAARVLNEIDTLVFLVDTVKVPV
jgi:hypothetical protein